MIEPTVEENKGFNPGEHHSPEEQKHANFMLEALRREVNNPIKPVWLSFADESGFRGVAIVREKGLAHAIDFCWQKGINPGGSVQYVELGEEGIKAVPEEAYNRLLSKEDLKQYDLI